MQEVYRVFLFQYVALFEPSAKFLQSFFRNASGSVVIITFFTAWIVCWVPLLAPLALIFKWQPSQPLPPEQKLPLLASLYLLAPLVLWGSSWLTNTPFSDYGFFGNISILYSCVLGCTLGVLSIAVVFSWQLWLEWCSFQKSNLKLLQPILLPIFLVALFVGGIEELVFRGFLFTELDNDYPVWVAAVISSLIFAFLHLIWEQQETIPQLPGLWLMGMVLVLARFINEGSIGLAWGLHAGWVWAIACLDTAQLIEYTEKVPEWVTGKNRKPLAGVVGIACLVLAGGVLLLGSGYF